MPVKDYNADPDLNTQISGINIAEGCAPSGINNAIRQLMADVKEEFEGVVRSVNGQGADDDGAVRLWGIDKGDVSANTLTAPGVYYVSGDNTGVPSGTNGYIIVESLNVATPAIRQVFYRVGTVNSNEHNIYTRARSGSGTWGAWVKMLTDKDSDVIAGYGMPSEEYENLSFGAHGTVYTMPANGWVNISAANEDKTNAWLTLDVQTSDGTRYLRSQAVVTTSVTDCMFFVPVRKGDKLRLGYNAKFSASIFRFIYAEGAK